MTPLRLTLNFVTALAVSLVLPAFAQENPNEEAVEAPLPLPNVSGASEYGGVLTNQAITSLGHYFHERFAEAWSTRKDSEAYTLSVKERSSPRVGTEMQVIFMDLVVFRGNLPRNLSAISAMAESAAETSYRNISDMTLQALLFNDPDVSASGL